MSDLDQTEAIEHEFAEIRASASAPTSRLTLGDLNGVRLNVSADLGGCKMRIREILELREGSIVLLNKLAGEMTDIYIEDRLLARGEVVPIGDNLHVRIHEVIGVAEDTLAEDRNG